MLEEYAIVYLTEPIPAVGVTTDSVGTIVVVYDYPSRAYEVEFCDDNGDTIALITLTEDQLRPAFDPASD